MNLPCIPEKIIIYSLAERNTPIAQIQDLYAGYFALAGAFYIQIVIVKKCELYTHALQKYQQERRCVNE